MSRTRMRPIPRGRVAKSEALGLGLVLSIGSVMTMAFCVDYLAAALLAGTIAFYVFVYTMWLKRRTAQNIVIGGAAGALPPMIGWAAVSGSLSLEPIVLFLIIFMWTPPHFWALALYRAEDYAKVGVPMMPVVAGQASTRWQILIYSLLLVPLTAVPVLAGWAGPLYGAVAALAGVLLLFLAARLVWQQRAGDATAAGMEPASASHRAPRALFAYSILYLFLIFGGLLLDRLSA